MVVIPLQVLANMASVATGESGPYSKDWVIWNQVFLLVDAICCCAIIFPIVWSIRLLKEASETDEMVWVERWGIFVKLNMVYNK